MPTFKVKIIWMNLYQHPHKFQLGNAFLRIILLTVLVQPNLDSRSEVEIFLADEYDI
jgi:hypothetical protein